MLPSSHAEPPSPGAPVANVLLVDDHPPNLLALEAVLEPLGARLVRAGSGTQALEHLLREEFAVIVLDVQMPGLDGFETAALIRQRERTREVPILFVTAIYSDEAHQSRGYAHGAVDYLAKPFNPDVLRAKVAALIALWQRGEILRRGEAQLHAREKAVQEARVRELAGDLRESEARLRRVLEASGAGLWDLDAATGSIVADPRLIELMGLPAGSSLTLASALEAMPAEDRERVAGAVASALAGESGGRYAVEFRTGGRGGAPERWVESRGHVLVDDGTPAHLAGAALDVTARKQAEAAREDLLRALGESEERYRLATRATKDAIWDWDLVTDGISWNEGVCELFGYAAGEVGHGAAWWHERIHPDDRERVMRGIQAARDTPERHDWHDEYRFRRQEGRYALVADRGWVARDACGRALRIVGAMQDVTEARGAEAVRLRLARHNALAGQVGVALTRGGSLREMLQACAVAMVAEVGAALACVWVLPPGGTVLELEASAGLSTRLDGADARVPVGSSEVGLVAREKKPRQVDAIGRGTGASDAAWARREGLESFAGYPLIVGDALLGVVALFTASPLPGDTLDALRLVADSVALGVERRRGEEERLQLLEREQRARAAAEEANELKDQFLATVSHELRTPLTAMLGWVQILRGGTLPPERHARALATVERNARAQAQIIEDLLDVSRILAGKLRLEVEPVELRTVVEAALETVRPAADAKSLRLEAALAPGTMVMGDPHRLQQVVWNLLANAVKFTPRGGSVEALVEPRDSSVEVIVADTGQGIAPDFQAHVFERFRQADGTSTRAHGGLGVGLSIVRQLVELHGGTVSVASEGEGRGARFTVRLPRTARRREGGSSPTLRAVAPLPDASRRSVLAGLRLLVVDDEEDLRELLRTLLEGGGARVSVAASAADAFRLFQAERPAVLLADIGMPGEDGYALVERIRALPPGSGGEVPAIALTAYARGEDRTRALLAGFTTHLAKPVDPAELLSVVAELSGRSPERP